MNYTRRNFVTLMATAAGAAAITSLVGCSTSAQKSSSSSVAAKAAVATGTLALNQAAWNYDADNDVYWQIGLAYCATPAASDYEKMGIYVPGAYFEGTKNADGTWTCKINDSGSKGDFNAKTAPIVFPINTGGYSAQMAPTSYSYNGLSTYLDAGFIYVYAGMRGRDNGYDSSGKLSYSGGAPWGVTDLKAAIRYYRYNSASLPGNANSMFTFGHSGGGAQSALAGATGDSELYTPYLESIGAAMKDSAGTDISDAISGSMCWCPITSLDIADEAYEWNMGQFATTGTRADGTWTKALSGDMAGKFASFINVLGLKDPSNNKKPLTLDASSTGTYLAGSYYDYLVSVVEGSLNNFLSDTTFPYTPSATTMVDGGFGGGTMGSTMGGSLPSDASGSASGLPDRAAGATGGGMMGGMGASSTASSTTYQTVDEYIASLNSDETWITYDASKNTAKISSLSAFITHCKNASKDVCAFDALDRTQAENNLFGNDDADSLHFDQTIADLLAANGSTYAQYSGYDTSYASAYAGDLKTTDRFGNGMATRVNSYNPMYYASDNYEGYQRSTIAPHWRIRTGINQGDTALTTETNLALALKQNPNVADVDFETVWGLGHTPAERTGSSSENFVSWVKSCCS